MTTDSLKLANKIRCRIVKGAAQTPSRGSHLGGSLSCVDMLASIASVFSISTEPTEDNEACLVLSKDMLMALYALLVEIGSMSISTYNTFQTMVVNWVATQPEMFLGYYNINW